MVRFSLPGGNAFFYNVLDTTIGALKNQIDQLTAIDFWGMLPNIFNGMAAELTNGSDFVGCPAGDFLHASKQENDPFFPFLLPCDLEQEAVVVLLVADDVAAELENGQREQILLNKKQAV